MAEDARIEALECLAKAEAAWSTDPARAINLAQKSLRMCDTPEARRALEKFQNSSNNSPPPATPPTARRRSQGEVKAAVFHKHEEKNYSVEDHTIAIKICQTKDYYQLLGVTREAGEKDVKSAYRKLVKRTKWMTQ